MIEIYNILLMVRIKMNLDQVDEPTGSLLTVEHKMIGKGWEYGRHTSHPTTVSFNSSFHLRMVRHLYFKYSPSTIPNIRETFLLCQWVNPGKHQNSIIQQLTGNLSSFWKKVNKIDFRCYFYMTYNRRKVINVHFKLFQPVKSHINENYIKVVLGSLKKKRAIMVNDTFIFF